MTPASLAAFTGASILLAFAPGPDILTVITRSVAQGTRAGLVATLGFASGITIHTTVTAIVQTLLLTQLPRAFPIVRIIGALYLVYLAIRMLLARDPLTLDQTGTAQRRALTRIYGQSFLMNVLNPKVTLFFLGFLPQFVQPGDALGLPLQFAILGALFAAATILCFGLAAILAGRLSGWLRRKPGAARPLRVTVACVFLAVAARLALP